MSWANRIALVLSMAIIVFTTIAYGAVHQPIIAIFYVLVAALLVLLSIDGFKSGTININRAHIQFPLFAAAAYGLVQTIPFGELASAAGLGGLPRTISYDPFATQMSAFHFLVLGLFFSAMLVLVNSASRIRTLVILISVFGFVFAFFAILQSVLSPGKIYGIYEVRFAVPFGSFVNRHNFAAYMEMTIGVPLGMLFAGAVGRDKRLLYVTAIALMGVALLMSGSRGGLVAFLAQIIFLVMLTTGAKSRKGLVMKVGFSGILIGAIVIGSIFIGGESSLTRIAETATSKDITTDRGHIWSVTTKLIANSLPFGAGFGAYGVAYTPHDTYSGLERVEQAHNDYLQVIADAGLVGAVIGLYFLFLLFRSGLRSAKTGNIYRRGVAIGAMAGCFAILVHSIFDFVLHTTAISVLFLTLVTLIVACREEYDDDLDLADIQKGRTFSSTGAPIPMSTFRRSGN
ncbi:MAG TPA: O-antigen ligase family protein [Pyrinomonadaceae bacterium]|nr:O-antigen ligase family protein [Pyrinomonadaceae bacterium]